MASHVQSSAPSPVQQSVPPGSEPSDSNMTTRKEPPANVSQSSNAPPSYESTIIDPPSYETTLTNNDSDE